MKNEIARIKADKTGVIRFLPMLIIIAGSALSFIGFFEIYNRQTANIEAEFRKEARNHVAALQNSLDEKLLVLDSIIHFFKGSVSVEREEFSEFVTNFLESPALDTLKWVPRVQDADRGDFEKKVTNQWGRKFQIFEFDENRKPVPAKQRDEYFPVYYIAPGGIDSDLAGFDIASIPDRVISMNYSRDTGKASATGNIPLPTDPQKNGFKIFCPFYTNDAPIENIEDRRENLEGFVVGIIRKKELIEESLKLISSRGVEVQLYDLNAPDEESFIYKYIPGQTAGTGESESQTAGGINKKMLYEEKIAVSNRTWLVKCSPTPALISLFRTAEPWGLLIGGHILTVICAAYLIVSEKRTAAIEGLVQLRTSELNTELNEHKLTEQALKSSESQFRTLVENIPGAVFRCRLYPPWEMEHISKAILGITGYPSEDFIKEEINIGDLIITSDCKMVEESVNKSIKTKEPYVVEYGIYHANESIRYIHERGNTAYDTDGHPLYLDGVIVDITDRRKNEEERERLLRTIETKNKELQSIVYVASHDLRSPLVNIMGFSDELEICCQELKDLLNNDILTGDDHKKIEILLEDSIPQSLKFISSGTNNINMLINGLLQVSRAGSVSIVMEPIDMNTLAGDVVENMVFHARELGATITVEQLPQCMADGPMANQVFSNLIGNALKYLDPERKGQIKVTGKLQGNNCIYCVADNGLGIPEQSVEKVFEIFHRLNPSDAEGGEGLGLTIVTRILDRLHGSIYVESEFGEGSKFYVTLPKA